MKKIIIIIFIFCSLFLSSGCQIKGSQEKSKSYLILEYKAANLDNDQLLFKLYFGVMKDEIDYYFSKYSPLDWEIVIYIVDVDLNLIDSKYKKLKNVNESCFIDKTVPTPDGYWYRSSVNYLLDLSEYPDMNEGYIGICLKNSVDDHTVVLEKQLLNNSEEILESTEYYKIIKFKKNTVSLNPNISVDKYRNNN